MATILQKATAHLSRLYPLYSGCGNFSNSWWFRKITKTATESVWTEVLGGEVLANLNDYIGRSVYFCGAADKKVSWVCQRIVQPGDTVIDIGANIGELTVLFSSLVGNKGEVHSFEPNPLLFGCLQQAQERNQMQNVQLYPVALGNDNTTMELVIPKENMGSASLVRHKNRNHCEKITVNVCPLDTTLELTENSTISLLKVDVEGFEETVLSGAHKLLSKKPPQVILFELNNRTSRNLNDEAIIKLLSKYDYSFVVIPKNIFHMKLNSINLNQTDHPQGHDFLAIHRGDNFAEICQRLKISP
ncbi:MAG: FkbM family methyltransferase [Cellvibrionaceae bacterium]